VAVDLSDPAMVRKIIHDLIPHCDVLIENFKVGRLQNMVCPYDQLKSMHPRLIYASITGFGQTGPLANSKPGYDFLAQGMSGFMKITRARGWPTDQGGGRDFRLCHGPLCGDWYFVSPSRA
jgi:crotonobetainyl-CoA:carnitine CoA-transferase CaiB-like acyl-CoA transferase